MPNSPENSKGLDEIALKAVAAMAAGALVHYFWNRDKTKIQAYVYRFRDSSEGVLVGLVKEGQERIQQFAGRLASEGKNKLRFIVDNDKEINDDGIERLEEIIQNAEVLDGTLQKD